MAKVLISHSWKDGEISKKVSDSLFEDGAEVWIDYNEIRGGSKLPKKMGEGIVWCDTFVLLWSADAAESPWVEEEWHAAWMLKKLIVPCALDDTQLPPMLLSRDHIDFRNFGKGYKILLKALDLKPKKERVTVGGSVKVEVEKPRSNELSLACDPATGGSGTIIRATVAVKGNAKEVCAFGFDLHFNPSVFKYVKTLRGPLTKVWTTVDGNEVQKGEMRVGGFAGAGKSIEEGSEGAIAVVKLRVACRECKDGAGGRVTVSNLMDDITKMKPAPESVEFIYKREKEERLLFSHQYIKMCIEGIEEIKFVRIFNSKKGEWLGKFTFKKGDYFNHPKLGENEAREVGQVGKSNLRAVNDPYPYRIKYSIWIPTAEQLADEAQQIPWDLDIEAAKDYYKLQNHVLSSLSDEEQVLSYWMEFKCGKIWDFDKQKWIQIESQS